MNKIETSRWPVALFAGLAVVLLSSAVSAKSIKTKMVNCGNPAQTLASALSSTSSDTVDEIVFTGICIEDLTITKDDVTLRGEGDAPEIRGQINIDGAHRVSLRDFTLTAGDHGVFAFDGAAIRINHVDISGAAEFNIQIQRNAFADVRNSTIDGAGVVNIFVSRGSSLDIRNSFIEDAGEIGIEVTNSSFARIINTSVTDSVDESVFVQIGSSARLQNANLNTFLLVQEGSHVRIIDSTLFDDNDVALRVIRGATARLKNGGNVLTSGISQVISVTGHSMLEQSKGHDTITGDIDSSQNSYIRINDADIIGDINVERHSGLLLQDNSPGGGPTLVGSVIISQDSYAELHGESVITGSVTCNDSESSLEQPLDVDVTVTGGVFCTGF